MTICFYTLGCKVNQYETEAMAERMRAAAALGIRITQPSGRGKKQVASKASPLPHERRIWYLPLTEQYASAMGLSSLRVLSLHHFGEG